MVASTDSELKNNLCIMDSDEKINLVRAAVIYGANASGKSNLLSALLFMRMFVIRSAKESQQGEKFQLRAFHLMNQARINPVNLKLYLLKIKQDINMVFLLMKIISLKSGYLLILLEKHKIGLVEFMIKMVKNILGDLVNFSKEANELKI